MDTTNNVARFISSSIPTVAQTDVTMNIGLRAWTKELQWINASTASKALDDKLGLPDASIPFFWRRWSFAGTTIFQRGSRATITEHF